MINKDLVIARLRSNPAELRDFFPDYQGDAEQKAAELAAAEGTWFVQGELLTPGQRMTYRRTGQLPSQVEAVSPARSAAVAVAEVDDSAVKAQILAAVNPAAVEAVVEEVVVATNPRRPVPGNF